MDAKTVRERLIAMGIHYFSADIFIAYHKKKPDVWREFEAAALALCADGAQRISAKHVCEKIRYERQINKQQGEFKVSNSMVSLYVRVFVLKYPHFSERFVLKEAVGPKVEAA